MNKLSALCFVLLFVSASLFSLGNDSDLSKEQEKMLRQTLMDMIEIIPQELKSTALSQVSKARFYKVTLKIILSDNTWTGQDLHFVYDGKKFLTLGPIDTNRKMSNFRSMLSRQFKIKSKEDAQVLEAAMDTLFPVSSFDIEDKTMRQEGQKWIFIRGKFFEDEKGFVFTTDKNGRITEVEYFLEISID